MPIDPHTSDDSIPTLTEIVQVPGTGTGNELPKAPDADDPTDMEALRQRIQAAVSTEVLRQLDLAIDIRFRADLQRALQDAVDDACDALHQQLSKELKDAVTRAVSEAMSRVRSPL
jgi:hypothetical protein